MWFAINCHPCPPVDDDLDVGSMDVLICVDKMGSEDGGIQLGRSDGVLFGDDIGCVLHGVSGNYHAVVGFGVAREWSEIPLEWPEHVQVSRSFDLAF